MKKLLFIFISAFVLNLNLNAQSDLTFYHLKEATPLHGIYNPVSFPEGRWYISLPGLSGIDMNINTGLSYNDIMEPVEGTDSVRISPTNILSKLNSGSRFDVSTTISLFQFGVKIKDKGAVHISVNERIQGGANYPTSLLDYIVNGNANFLDQTISQTIAGNLNYYREYGLGYSHQLEVLGGKELRVGARVKLIQGLLYAGTSDQSQLSFLTEEEGNYLSIGVSDFNVNTVGFNAIEDDVTYMISNTNKGVGVDLGMDLAVNDKLSVSFSINDLGSINWKESVESHAMEDNSLRLDFLDLKDLDNSIEVLSDTIEHLFEIEAVEGGAFKSNLNTRVFLSGSYKLLEKGTAHATILAKKHFDQFVYSYGAGYTHKLGNTLLLSTTFSYNDIKGFQWGGALATQLAFMQLHFSFDNMIGLGDVRKLENITFRTGISFVFGRSPKKNKVEEEVFDPFKYTEE